MLCSFTSLAKLFGRAGGNLRALLGEMFLYFRRVEKTDCFRPQSANLQRAVPVDFSFI